VSAVGKDSEPHIFSFEVVAALLGMDILIVLAKHLKITS
jgi:hypothetical protein